MDPRGLSILRRFYAREAGDLGIRGGGEVKTRHPMDHRPVQPAQNNGEKDQLNKKKPFLLKVLIFRTNYYEINLLLSTTYELSKSLVKKFYIIFLVRNVIF